MNTATATATATVPVHTYAEAAGLTWTGWDGMNSSFIGTHEQWAAFAALVSDNASVYSAQSVRMAMQKAQFSMARIRARVNA